MFCNKFASWIHEYWRCESLVMKLWQLCHEFQSHLENHINNSFSQLKMGSLRIENFKYNQNNHPVRNIIYNLGMKAMALESLEYWDSFILRTRDGNAIEQQHPSQFHYWWNEEEGANPGASLGTNQEHSDEFWIVSAEYWWEELWNILTEAGHESIERWSEGSQDKGRRHRDHEEQFDKVKAGADQDEDCAEVEGWQW